MSFVNSRGIVISILEYLEEEKLLSKVEGIVEHIPAIQEIVDDHLKWEKNNWIQYVTYWLSIFHAGHEKWRGDLETTETCPNTVCSSIRETLEDLKK